MAFSRARFFLQNVSILLPNLSREILTIHLRIVYIQILYAFIHIDRSMVLSRDEDERHGVKIHVGLFQRRYNGTYTQAHGH